MTQTTTAAAPTPDTNITAPQNPPAPPDPGPPRSGHPRGNPNLAPRCGAKARTTGCPCRAPAMPNGRCRMHGGKSTGPRTPKGFADLAEARTKHGLYTAAARATYCYRRKLATRTRTLVAVLRLRAYLPSELEARIAQGPYELVPPPRPTRRRLRATRDNTPCNVAWTAPARDANGRFLAPCSQADRAAGRARGRPAGTRDAGALARRHQAGEADHAPAEVPGPERPPRATRTRFTAQPTPRPQPRCWHAAPGRADDRQRLDGGPLPRQDPRAATPAREPQPRPHATLQWCRRSRTQPRDRQPRTVPPCESPATKTLYNPRTVPSRENPNQDITQPSRGAVVRESQSRPHATSHRAAARRIPTKTPRNSRGAAVREFQPRPHAPSHGAAHPAGPAGASRRGPPTNTPRTVAPVANPRGGTGTRVGGCPQSRSTPHHPVRPARPRSRPQSPLAPWHGAPRAVAIPPRPPGQHRQQHAGGRQAGNPRRARRRLAGHRGSRRGKTGRARLAARSLGRPPAHRRRAQPSARPPRSASRPKPPGVAPLGPHRPGSHTGHPMIVDPRALRPRPQRIPPAPGHRDKTRKPVSSPATRAGHLQPLPKQAPARRMSSAPRPVVFCCRA